MSTTLEDHVLNQAATKLGFDKEEPNINQGYGQNTSFKNLGYPQSHHQPDGWYIPNDKNAAIISETKRPSEDVTNQKHIDQLLTNCAVLATTHRNVIGILYNGKETNIFINGDHIPELSGKPLEHKSFYLNYIKDQTLDKKSFIVIPPKTNFSDRFTGNPKPFTPRHFVTVSSLTKNKNLEELIYAIGYYNSAYREIYNLDPIYLDIYGRGPEEYALQEAISKTKMTEVITLKGHLGPSDTIAHYNGYLSTSRSECYGISLLEALSQGLPLIGLDVPIANQKYIPRTGYLVPVDNNYNFSYLDYVRAIDKLITNHKELQRQIKDFLNQPLYHPNATKNAYERLSHE